MNKPRLISTLSVFTFALQLNIALSQNFEKIYESTSPTDYIIIRDIFENSDQTILAGFDIENSSDPPTAGMMKLNNKGEIIWAKEFNIPESFADCAFEVLEKANGNYYFWGLSKEEETEHMRAILSEISPEGDEIWSKAYDFGENSNTYYTINKIHLLPSGELQMLIAVYNRVIVIRTDANGNIIWGKASSMGPPEEGGKNPGFEWLSLPENGGMCASKAEDDFSLLRYSEEGELLWNKSYAIGDYTHGKTIALSPNGNILVAGYIDYDLHIMEISPDDGSINWIKMFNQIFFGRCHLQVIDEDILLDYCNGDDNHYIINLNADGEIIETVKSKYLASDYNKLSFNTDGKAYFYGTIGETEDTYEGLISQTESIMSNSCVIESYEGISNFEYLDYSESDFTPYEESFTAQEDIDISLIDYAVNTRNVCDHVTEINENRTNEITVFPTPAMQQLTISSVNMIGRPYSIFDVYGKNIRSGKILSNEMEIELSGFSSGQHILVIYGDEDIFTKKLIIE